MIIVQKFPHEANSLSELIGVFRDQRFELESRWSYDSNAELNVFITIRGEHSDSLESILSAYLSAHGFQYVFAPDCDYRMSHDLISFVMMPFPGACRSGISIPTMLNKASLFVLLTGLEKSRGSFILRLTGDSVGLQIAVSVSCLRGHFPHEAGFAFGRRFSIAASESVGWFKFIEHEHSDLLTMPYTTPEGCSLVTGFGDASQAIIGPMASNVTVGTIFNDALARKLCFTSENWKSSTCVWGAPGYGKSTMLTSLLFQAYQKQNIKFLVIEPKTDYRRLRRLIPEMVVITSLRGFNPLIPPKGCDPYEYAEVLLDLLNLATEMPPESPLPDYIRRVYHQAVVNKNYGMDHFLQLYDALMQKMGFTGEAVNFCRAGRNRIATLFRIFCGRHFASKNFPGLDITRLLDRPAVVEIGKASTQKMVTVFTYYIIAHVRMVMQSRETGNITNCLVVEEAHNVLSPMLNEQLRFDIANVLAEGRGRGISVIICDQSPSRVDPMASNLCGNIVSFRVVSQADREYVAQQLGTDSNLLNDLRKECVIARTNGMFQPENIHVDVDRQILELQPLSNEELRLMT